MRRDFCQSGHVTEALYTNETEFQFDQYWGIRTKYTGFTTNRTIQGQFTEGTLICFDHFGLKNDSLGCLTLLNNTRILAKQPLKGSDSSSLLFLLQ